MSDEVRLTAQTHEERVGLSAPLQLSSRELIQ